MYAHNYMKSMVSGDCTQGCALLESAKCMHTTWSVATPISMLTQDRPVPRFFYKGEIDQCGQKIGFQLGRDFSFIKHLCYHGSVSA